jgi:hypothetical protein
METLNFIVEQGFNGINDIEDIIGAFYKKWITVSYQIKENYTLFIFTSKKIMKTNINSECNGLILESNRNGWKIVCTPSKYPIHTLPRSYRNYDIYKISDGTTVNLYYLDGWNMSTTKGIRVNDVRFNKLTFSEALHECLADNNINVDEFYDSLDKNINYSIGFKHPDLHPFNEGKEEPIYRVWAVHKYDGEYVRENSIPLLKDQESLLSFDNNLLKSSYDDFVDKKEVNYGYLLVNREKTGPPVVLLESDLLKHIKYFLYDKMYQTYVKTNKLTDKRKIILLNAFLESEEAKDMFLNLFPSSEADFKEIEELENSVVEYIKNSARQPDPIKKDFLRIYNKFGLNNNKIIDVIRNKKNMMLYYKIWI